MTISSKVQLKSKSTNPSEAATVCALLVVMLGSFHNDSFAVEPISELNEFRSIIHSNMPSISDAEFDRLAIDGVVAGLPSKIWFAQEEGTNSAKVIAADRVFDDEIAYVRAGKVAGSLAADFTEVCRAMAETNQLKGVVLDLRFAGGQDYAAAAGFADLFLRSEQDLLDWGAGMHKSTTKSDPLTWPVAVLINAETTGSAEALAALLRETGSGLLLGSKTRGAATIPREVTLSDGRRLCISSSPVKLGGNRITEITEVIPDIEVKVALANERKYLANPYLELVGADSPANAASSTNRVARRSRISEAELVRAHRESNGFAPDEVPPRTIEPEVPVIQDPSLARAVDLLKGLAVVRRSR